MARQEISHGGLRWIHVHQPTADDLAFIRSLHSFDEIVMDYVAFPTLHPSLEEFGDNVYFILHFPVIYHTHEHNKIIEIDFLMTKTVMVTVTYEPYERLEELYAQCTQREELMRKYFRSHSGYIMFMILEFLYKHMIEDRDSIEKTIDTLERDIFSTPDEALVERIADVSRDVLDFRRIFDSQGSVVELLPRAMERLFGENSIPKFTSLVVTHGRVRGLLDNHKETDLAPEILTLGRTLKTE